ncbi:alpha/beta-hydrolase [Laetiporus sulphureus 93-53]|uniref:Alpha/beta-hydrolase n=1 Tax=Laetiporus sulphureus 93-53 TaxID=1314785 RepID=A0A165HRI7_9APHY|nr:alpha/beta-hydrolase [Laetiporus sulphureus 93-53]KZT12087.1 alpha/beta-hydrolase [Laetiporus sulphureus 93-53]
MMPGDSQSPVPITLIYKHVDGLPLLLDVYLPNEVDQSGLVCYSSALVYFHGGGLTVGNRRSWFPHWLYRRVTSADCIFISADYRLLPPSTGHDLLADIKDVIDFVAHKLNQSLSESVSPVTKIRVAVDSIAVAGTSSGGLCAYLAAIHARPRPKAVLSMYGMGGMMLTPHYYYPKSSVFFRGRELLDPTHFSEYLYPDCRQLSPISDSALAYHPLTSPTPGYPANPRMLLARLYLQLGVFLDYYTGCHELSLSKMLRSSTAGERKAAQGQEDAVPDIHQPPTGIESVIPREHLPLFPHLNISSSWPPTLLVHGSIDSAILPAESIHLHAMLQDAGVETNLVMIDGMEHSFDYQPGAENTYGSHGGLFDQAAKFVIQHLRDNDL